MGSHLVLICYRKEDGKVKEKCSGQNGGRDSEKGSGEWL